MPEQSCTPITLSPSKTKTTKIPVQSFIHSKIHPCFFIRLGCLLEQLLFVINSVKRIVRMTYQNKFFLFFGINGIILILMYNYIEAADLFTVPKRIERIIRKTYILVFGY